MIPKHTDHSTPSKQYIGCAECQKRGGELAKAYLVRNPHQRKP